MVEPGAPDHAGRSGLADPTGLADLTGTTLPERLLLLGLAQPWPSDGIDPTDDIAHLGGLPPAEGVLLARLCRTVLAGTARDPAMLAPFLQVARQEGRLADELLLTQMGFAQARHRTALGRWLEVTGLGAQAAEPGDEDPHTHRLLHEALDRLQTDPDLTTHLATVTTALLVVDGMLTAVAGQAVALACQHRGTAPDLHRLITAIGQDQRRMLAWATFTCRRLVAADDRRWGQLEALLAELNPPALAALAALAGPPGAPGAPLLGLDGAALARTGYAHTARRLGVIATGRGRDPQHLDVDDEPLALEQRLAAEQGSPGSPV